MANNKIDTRKFKIPVTARQSEYPIAGTNADRVLTHIKANPGCSTESIRNTLDLNPSVVRRILAALLDAKCITDTVDDRGYHHWNAVTE